VRSLEEILHRAHVLSLSRKNDELNVGDDEVVSSEVAEGGDCGKVRGKSHGWLRIGTEHGKASLNPKVWTGSALDPRVSPVSLPSIPSITLVLPPTAPSSPTLNTRT